VFKAGSFACAGGASACRMFGSVLGEGVYMPAPIALCCLWVSVLLEFFLSLSYCILVDFKGVYVV
jgi:hypothetical protein